MGASMPTEKRFTISDIAKEVGVSTTTVSRYLSGQYRYMSKTTREKSRIAIQKNGYRPSLVARGLKASRSYLIGVIMPQVHRTNSSHSIRNICLACSKTMYSPIIVSIEDNVEMEERRIQELLDHRVDGILTFTGSGDQYYENVAKEGIPVVRVDRCGDRRTMDSVVVNHYEVVQEALLNLSVSGYANIAIFSNRFYMSPYSTVGIRRKAYFDFMAKAEGLSPMEYIIDFNDIQSVKSAVHTYLDACVGKPTAVFVPSMENLTTLDWVCKLMGLRYPDDIALLGYALEDDVLSATSRLSVISYPLEEMCNTALSLLMARIAGEPSLPEPPVMKKIPASLIIRDSTILRV